MSRYPLRFLNSFRAQTHPSMVTRYYTNTAVMDAWTLQNGAGTLATIEKLRRAHTQALRTYQQRSHKFYSSHNTDTSTHRTGDDTQPQGSVNHMNHTKQRTSLPPGNTIEGVD